MCDTEKKDAMCWDPITGQWFHSDKDIIELEGDKAAALIIEAEEALKGIKTGKIPGEYFEF